MSETPEKATESVYAGPVVAEHRDHRLHTVLTWVGIVTGVVLTIAVIFFSGFALGRASGYHGWHRGYQGQIGPGWGGGCPAMRNDSTVRPGSMMDPDDMGPAMMRPGPSSVPSQSSIAPGPAPAQR